MKGRLENEGNALIRQEILRPINMGKGEKNGKYCNVKASDIRRWGLGVSDESRKKTRRMRRFQGRLLLRSLKNKEKRVVEVRRLCKTPDFGADSTEEVNRCV